MSSSRRVTVSNRRHRMPATSAPAGGGGAETGRRHARPFFDGPLTFAHEAHSAFVRSWAPSGSLRGGSRPRQSHRFQSTAEWRAAQDFRPDSAIENPNLWRIWALFVHVCEQSAADPHGRRHDRSQAAEVSPQLCGMVSLRFFEQAKRLHMWRAHQAARFWGARFNARFPKLTWHCRASEGRPPQYTISTAGLVASDPRRRLASRMASADHLRIQGVGHRTSLRTRMSSRLAQPLWPSRRSDLPPRSRPILRRTFEPFRGDTLLRAWPRVGNQGRMEPHPAGQGTGRAPHRT